MGLLSGLASIALGCIVTAWLASRARGSVIAVVVVTLPFLVFQRYLVQSGEVAPALGVALVAAQVAAAWVAMSVGWIAASHRKTAAGLEAPVGDELLIADLVDLCRRAVTMGFEPVPNTTVWMGEMQATLLVHPDGTVAELVCTPGLEPGFGLASQLDDGTWVMSSPYAHGTDRTKLRLPGATFEELVDHHRPGVEARAGGRSVTIPDRETLLRDVLEIERTEMNEVHAAFWWNCFLAWYRQMVPGRYAEG